MDKYLARDSVEALRVEVRATSTAGTAVDPSSYPVAVAILPDGVDPEPADFTTASWAQGPATTVAVLLAGPLTPGRYRAWVQVTASPEVPVMRSPTGIVVY